MKTLTRREFFNVCTKENVRHVLGALKGFQEGEKETTRPSSCDEAAMQLAKDRQRLHQHKRKRKEGQSL